MTHWFEKIYIYKKKNLKFYTSVLQLYLYPFKKYFKIYTLFHKSNNYFLKQSFYLKILSKIIKKYHFKLIKVFYK